MRFDDGPLNPQPGTPFRHSLPVSEAIFGLPVYVTSAGWERVPPEASYPLADTGLNSFKWEDGRILPEFCLAWVEEGAGYLETIAGRQEIPARRAFLYMPGEWHRHRPPRHNGMAHPLDSFQWRTATTMAAGWRIRVDRPSA